MATFTRTANANPSGLEWGAVLQWVVVGTPTSTSLTLQNTDGTVNVFIGTGFTFDGSNNPTGGNITSITQQTTGGSQIRTLTYAATDTVHTLVAMFNSAPNIIPYLLDSNDTLVGNGGGNNLTAFAGDDNLRGLAGNDTLDGGLGTDEARYDRDAAAGGLGAVTVNLATGIATDGFGNTDTLISIEAVRGTSLADTLTGGNVANDGFEGFRGLGGNDIISGGSGFDEVRYDQDSANLGAAAVTVNLVLQTAIDGFGNTDTLSSIEGARGTLLADTFIGDGNDNTFTGLQGADNISGGGGFDTVRYDVDANFAGGTGGVTVNLATGTATDGFGSVDVLTSIENVRGTAVSDSLTGNAWDNQLNGGGGDDTLIGNDGFDFFTPGAGTDTVNGTPLNHPDQSYDDRDRVNYSDNNIGVGVAVNLTNATINGIGVGGVVGTFSVAGGTARDWNGNTDTLIDIERVRGTNSADFFHGSDTANLRDERFQGLGGADIINGGAGFDYAEYDRDAQNGGTGGVTVNLLAGTATDGFGATDTLIGIEGVIGTNGNDILTGDANRNSFRNLGGSDSIDGGGGLDTIQLYVDDTFNIPGGTVNLTTGAMTGLAGGTSTLINIEDVFGSEGHDNITGDANSNLLDGSAGNDVINGMAGDDIIYGGAGTKTLNGGDGNDILIYMYDPALGQYYTLQYASAFPTPWVGVTVNLATGTATNFAGGTDTISNFENVGGTFFNDNITGDAGDNGFGGFAGNDVIDGGAGNDLIYYGRWDNEGRTTVLLPLINSSDPDGVIVNLSSISHSATITSGTFNVAAGHAADGEGGNDTLISIENVQGSKGNDFIYGSDGDNVINADNGADTVDGGGGTDTISYDNQFAPSGVNVTINGAASGGDAQGDILSNIENIIGTNFADVLTGDGGNNVIEGGDGTDTLVGGGGIDTASFEHSDPPVNVVINGAMSGGHAQGDTMSGFENLRGGRAGDSLTGDGGANRLEGLTGDDLLMGLGGNDILDGGVGSDTANYSAATQAITAILSGGNGTASGADVGSDTLISIENVTGGAGGDGIFGDVNDNVFTGNGGADVMFGEGGHDTLQGGDGADTLVGNAGSIDINGVFAQESDIIDGGAGNDTINGEFTDIINGGTGTDFLTAVNSFNWNIDLGATNIEWMFAGFGDDTINASTQTAGVEIYGSGGIDTITGSAQGDLLWAGVGNDIVSGGGGDDMLFGDLGADSLSAGDGNDRLYVDSSDSLIDGGTGFDAVYITSGPGMTFNMAASTIEFVADFAGGNDTLNGAGLTADMIAYAGGGTDIITGGSGNDFLWGETGTDTITGNGGGDTLVGGTGADILTGGAGTDVIYMNSGGGTDGALDRAVFTAGWGTDFVFDFVHNEDKLDLSALGTSFGALTITNSFGHAYITIGAGPDLIAVANNGGLLTVGDFIFV